MCQYPSGAAVRVRIEGGERKFAVSDMGGALWEVESTGVTVADPARSWRQHLQLEGLTVIGGEIIAPEVDISLLTPAVMSVANASQRIAHEEIAKSTYVRASDFREALREYLKRKFIKRARHDVELAGQSNKKHVFAHIVEKLQGGILVIDPVLPEPASINSRIVAHIDLHNLKDQTITQRLIYDDREAWNAADLQVLSIGAPILAFSIVGSKLPALAEAA